MLYGAGRATRVPPRLQMSVTCAKRVGGLLQMGILPRRRHLAAGRTDASHRGPGGRRGPVHGFQFEEIRDQGAAGLLAFSGWNCVPTTLRVPTMAVTARP